MASVIEERLTFADQDASSLGELGDLSCSAHVIERRDLIPVLCGGGLHLAVSPIEHERGHSGRRGIDVLGYRGHVPIAAGKAIVVLVLGDDDHVVASRAAAGRIEPGRAAIVGADPYADA